MGFFCETACFVAREIDLVWDDADCWKVFILFGVWEKSRVGNAMLCKFLLSQARRAIKLRMGIAFYDKKIVEIWVIFKGLVIKQINYWNVYSGADLPLPSLSNNCLVSLKENGKLQWNWS